LANLTPASAASPSDFRQLAGSVREWLKGAENTLAEETGALGQTQAQLTSLQTVQSQTVTALTTQLSDAQGVDMASTITKLQDTQTILQASYSAISQLSSLSLAQYLS
jgi:flagellar hook-associated protein 3 FlgL